MAWTVILLPAALLAIFLWQSGALAWRDAALRALVLLGLLVASITEGLGAFGELQRLPLMAAWSAVVVIAALLAVLRSWPRRFPQFSLSNVAPLDAIAILGVIAIAAILAVIAWISPPNSADAMAYHMPRVLYWAQQRSVSFFPTPYYNQIMLQPLAEYFALHTFILSGGDHFVNFVQWLGMAGSIVCVSSIAQQFGAGTRGQTIAALFCATLPNGILQASGAKNDYLLALWLACLTYFALRYVEKHEGAELLYAGCSLGLALLTKATAYLFIPGVLLALAAPAWRSFGSARLIRIAVFLTVCALAINGPQYLRNIDLSGSPLGFDSAQGDGFFRWRNESFGWRQTASNLLRNSADQLGARSPRWNQGVYDAVLRVHTWIHAGANDPGTTWRWTEYQPPRNANHEANANNRWHLLILLIVAIALAARFRDTGALWRFGYLASLLLGFVLFSFYLKWQPFQARLLLPLFVLAAPVAGAEIEKLRPALLQWVVCLFLLNNARPYLFENWIRPLEGPNSILHTRRDDNYFSDLGQFHNRDSYTAALKAVDASGCGTVGIDSTVFQLEYPFEALLRETNPQAQFVHTGVSNASAKYAAGQIEQPCAVLCMNCAGSPERLRLYSSFGRTVQAGEFVIFLR